MSSCPRCRFDICKTCLIIPIQTRAWFCSRIDAVQYAAAREILDEMLMLLSSNDACPRRQPFEAGPDVYLVQDLDSSKQRGSAFQSLIQDSPEPQSGG